MLHYRQHVLGDRRSDTKLSGASAHQTEGHRRHLETVSLQP